MNQYNKYKETGIEWLNNIPSHWEKTRLRYLCDITTGGRDTINKEDDGEYPFFVRSKTIERISTYSFDGEAILTAGDGDICKIWHHVNEKFDFHQRVYMIYNFKKITGRFLYYYISENFYHDVFKLSAKNTVDSLRLPMFLNFPVLVPPLNEQAKITQYLDHQTATIDQLIQQKEKLIELLKEKRQAVINEALTKGLNPKAKMKDSEIEWLGEVPKDWRIVKLKHVVEMKSGNFISAEMIEDEGLYPVYGGNGIRGYHSEYTHEGFFPLVGRQGALCGNINYSNGKFWPTEHAVVVSPKKQVNMYWIGELLRLMNLNQYSQASAQPGLSVDKILNLRVPLPPIDEQNQIASKLESLIEKFELTSIKLEESIVILKEYRQSLISEAVAGKIDVREWQPNKQQVA